MNMLKQKILTISHSKSLESCEAMTSISEFGISFAHASVRGHSR